MLSDPAGDGTRRPFGRGRERLAARVGRDQVGGHQAGFHRRTKLSPDRWPLSLTFGLGDLLLTY